MKMTTIRTMLAAACAVLLCVLREVHGAEFIFGGEAKRVCKAYKLICPARKVCALQTIEYPRAMNFPVCVHEKHVVVKSSICRKAPQPGKCGAQFRRWYFNVHMGSCSWFTYGGCGGNQNNFRTAEECERRCMSDEDRIEANRERRRDRERNSIIVEDDRIDDDDDNVGNEEEEGREPTLITAPARAAEVIELDPDIKASLQLNGNQTDPITDWKEERRRRRKERRRRRRLRNKRRRKNRRNETSFNPAGEATPVQRVPRRKLTPQELGPSYGSATDGVRTPNYAEMRGSETTYSRFGDDEPQIWMMDRRFRRRRRRRRNRQKDLLSRSRDGSQPYAGAEQNTYYDTVKLFDILHNPEEEKSNQV